MGVLEIVRVDQLGTLARCSSAWETRASAKLVIGAPPVGSPEAIVLGAFQRSSDVPEANRPILRRGSGGGAAIVGPGAVWMQLALARSDVLVADCAPDKLLNRMVRPLLRAITRVASLPASYFGRDWISVSHRPVALVAFAHDSHTHGCLVEAIIGVSAPFAATPARAAFMGKEPATLTELARRTVDPVTVADAIATAYGAIASGAHELDVATVEPGELETVPTDPAWKATRDEAIGTIAAGRDASGRLRIGGELMASRDAVARLEDLVAALPPGASSDDVGRAVDTALAAPGVVTFGVRSLASIRDAILDAL